MRDLHCKISRHIVHYGAPAVIHGLKFWWVFRKNERIQEVE